MILQSCIFILDNKKTKGNLSTTDSLAALALKDSAAHIDSLKEHIDSLHTKMDSIKKTLKLKRRSTNGIFRKCCSKTNSVHLVTIGNE